MTFSYFKEKYKAVKPKNQRYITGFAFFSTSQGKTLGWSNIKNFSKKESFYQCLYIRLISEKNESKFKQNKFSVDKNNAKTGIEWQESISKHPLKQFFANPNLILSNQKSSFLIEKFTNSSGFGINSKSSWRLNKNSFQFSPKIFITYKKSFLSYWLLPLLGFMVSINSNFKSNFIQQNALINNYIENITDTKAIKNSEYSTKIDNVLLWKTKNINKKQHYNQYSKSLLFSSLNYYQKNRKVESLLIEKELKNLFLNIDFRKINLFLLEKKIQTQSSFNWSWFNLESKLLSHTYQNTNCIFPDKLSDLIGLPENKNLRKKNIIGSNQITDQKLIILNKNTNFFQLIDQEKIFSLSPISMLINKHSNPTQKIQESLITQPNSLPNYLVGVTNQHNLRNISKIKTDFSKNSPLDSINKSYFLIDQLSSNQTALFDFFLSLSNLGLEMDKTISSGLTLDNLKSNREKTLVSIFNSNSNRMNYGQKHDLINSSLKDKKTISSINSDKFYETLFDALKHSLKLDTSRKSILLKNKNLIVKNINSINSSIKKNNYKFKNQKNGLNSLNITKKLDPIFCYSSINFRRFIETQKDRNKNYDFSRQLVKESLISSKLSDYQWSPFRSNRVIPQMTPNSENLFKFLVQNSLNNSSYPKNVVSIKKNSINAGKFLPIKNNVKLNTSNFENSVMIQDSLFKTGKKQRIVENSKQLNQIEITDFSFKTDCLKTNQNSFFITTSNYLEKLTKKIKNGLNPYKLRFSYLPEISVFGSKKLKKIQSNKLTLKKVNSPNFEKVFLSYLSKSKKSKYSLKSVEINRINSFQTEMKSKTTERLKTLNNRYLKPKSENNNINFSRLNKNNSNLMVLKNRLFLNKFGDQKNVVEQNQDGSYLSSTIKTRQDLKVKRRLKKMKCETRRRKKRKIFYPRPNWIVFSLYKKFLDSRYSLKSSKSDENFLKLDSKVLDSSSNFNKPNRNINSKSYSSRQNYSHWLTTSRFSLDNSLFQRTIMLKNSNDFYTISKTVLSDLRRVLMKSNWLRSYLNPYLEKVKIIYKELQKSSKKMDTYINIRQLVGFIYGSPMIEPLNNQKIGVDNAISNEIYLNLRNSLYELENFQSFNKVIDPINLTRNSRLNREQRINLFEYNRIIYQRIQKSILNIRENLNLNGDLKNRSKKLSKNIRPFIKRDYIKREMVNGIPTNQNSGFWSKVFKSNVLKFGRSFISYQYDESSSYNNSAQLLSRNNFYWAVSKTSTFTTSNFNSSYTKKLWESSKIREISKSNKTKKIMFNLFMKYNNIFSPTAPFEGFDDILEIFKNDPNFINSKEFDNSRLTKFFYKKGVSSKHPILSYTNYSMDDEISQVALNLSPHIYVIKTEQKLMNIENKLKLLGLYSKKVEQNYKNAYFRFLKQELMKEKRFYYLNNLDKIHQDVTFKNIFKNLRQESLNPITTKNFLNSNSSTLANKNKMSNSYWWKHLNHDLDYLDQKHEFNFQKSSLVNISAFLFHFCALISFISLGGVRTLFKFYYILISKVSKLIGSFEKIENLLPKNKSKTNNSPEGLIKIDETFINEKFKNSQNEIMSLNSTNVISTKQLKRSKLLGKKLKLKSKTQIDVMNYLKLNFLKYLMLRKTKPGNLNFDSLNDSSNFISENESYKLSAKIKNQVFISKTQNLKASSPSKPTKPSISELSSAKKLDFKIKNSNKLMLFILNNTNKKKDVNFDLNSDLLIQNKLRLQYLWLVKSSSLAKFGHKSSFYIYLILLRSVDVLSIPASFIYKFFEKPGEYVVENLAYSFLVEWSADASSTIPDVIDTNSALYFTKLNRVVSSITIFNNYFMLNILNKLFNNSSSFNINLFIQNILFGAISNSVIKRVLNSSFLIFVQQLCEPDLDYINRSKKAQSIWDIWGEHLKTIAEQNSVNIYELTTDKQEQINLLSKYQDNLINNPNNDMSTKNHGLYHLRDSKENLMPKWIINNKLQKNSNQLIKNMSTKLKNLNSIQKVKIAPSKEFKYFRKKSSYNTNSWSVNQFLSYQGKDSDLFIDLHPPKTFTSSSATLKYSFSAQQPIGSIVCQIFSGIFYKQISKNILVVGSEGIQKSLLIQAIAGETELKIITDSAHRYAMVHRGVAVGIKLLKDVFEALSMHTPCIFLMEDIHVIGERRPFLIDEGSSNSVESPYNKNQSIQGLLLKEKNSASREGLYKNNKHLLSHYRKPYKEIKGLATNHFCFTFLFGDTFSKKRLNEITQAGNLRIQVLKKQNQSNFNATKSKLNGEFSSKTTYSSILEMQSSTIQQFSSSSSLNVLTLKETSKLKHKKTVKEMPWFGLPGEQFSLVSKYNYSIRVKVALLADLVLSNLSVKLDMITDLLVIIDSVKSNRGFAVFATTHLPYILDPALRRPGRFDETISVPTIPGLYSRWANYRSNIQYLRSELFNKYSIPFNYSLNKGIPLDLTHYVSNNNHFTMNKLINFIINSKKSIAPHSSNLVHFKNLRQGIKPSSKYLISVLRDKNPNPNLSQKILNNSSTSNINSIASSAKNYSNSLTIFKQKSSKLNSKNQITKKLFNRSVFKLRSKNYSYACKSLMFLFIYKHNKSEVSENLITPLKWPNLLKNSNNSLQDYSVYLTLFNSDKLMFRLILMSLIGVKVGEDFSNSFKLNQTIKNFNKANRIHGSFQFNFDKAWKYGSSILFDYVQKRQCSALTKNVAFSTSKLLSFNNKYSLMEPPGPPISNILLPSKRYENYKRSFNNQYGVNPNNFDGSISEKLQFHQQQRLLKRLYKYPIKQFFRSHLLTKDKNIENVSNFNNSYLTLAPLEKMNFNSINKISSVNWCYRNILYNRHKTYLTNQWWSGLQGEHNAETTFLSDIDWRYTFVESIGDIQVDFPDAEQYYNPRNRRWILTKGDWNYWFNFESDLKHIYSHYIYEAFTIAYKYLDKNREMIDFYVDLLQQSSLPQNFNDRNLLNLYKRFDL